MCENCHSIACDVNCDSIAGNPPDFFFLFVMFEIVKNSYSFWLTKLWCLLMKKKLIFFDFLLSGYLMFVASNF